MNNDILNENYWLERAPVSKAIWHMAIPMMLGMSVNMIYNLTDTYFIGRMNDTAALAAVTLVLPVTAVLMAVGNLFGTGGSTFFSRMIGKKDVDAAKTVSSLTFWMAVVSGIALAILCLMFQDPLVRLLGARGDVFVPTKQYVLVYVLGGPFVALNFALEQMVRGEGASTVSMAGMIISVVVNIVLDPIFIFGLGMGVAGAALATVLGNVCAVGYYVSYIRRSKGLLSYELRWFIPDKGILLDVLKIGIPAMLLDLFLVVSCLLLNFYSMKYGDYVVAGFGISQKIVQIVEFVVMGLYLGSVPLLAASYGAENRRRFNEILRKTSLYLFVLVMALAAVVFLFRGGILRMFSRDQAVLTIGRFILTVQLATVFFAGGSELLTGVFQATGKGIPSFVMSIARGTIFIPVIVICSRFAGLNGVIFSMTISEILAFTVGLAMFLRFWRNEARIGREAEEKSRDAGCRSISA